MQLYFAVSNKREMLAKLILELSFRGEDLNQFVFFVSSELFEWFWKIRETILEWFSVDREKKKTN